MNKKVVVRVAARGYVDGRYIGEEKEVIESVDPSGRGKRGRKPAGSTGRGGKSRGASTGGDDRGNRVSRGRGTGAGAGAGNASSNANGARRRPQAGAMQGAPGAPSVLGAAGERTARKSRGVRGERGERRGRTSSGVDQIGASATGANGNVDPAFANRGGNQTRAPRGAGRLRNERGERNERTERTERNDRNDRQGSANKGSKPPRRGAPRVPGAVGALDIGNTFGNVNIGNGAQNSDTPRARRNRGGKKTPFRTASNTQTLQGGVGARALISEVAETRRWGDESKSGQFADALAKEVNIKRERLHKVLAQSGYGSRRDMEIMITSGRVMVNGIVATTGTSVSASDAVMIDQRLVKIKFNEELPRVILYHKPDGEIVTTNDPGNRITVFDNLPRVENGKWMSIGRLDINTSGLLIFTTNGELANRLMHPRYEVEREYAVRVLGQLTEEQTAKLLSGVSIALEAANDDEDDGLDDVAVEDRPAKFDSIEARGGEGANQWYHVVLREGRNREVRKMFESVGLTVSRLIRVRFGKIGLPPRLTRGRMMELDDSQVRAVLRWVGMEVDGHIGALPTNHQPNRGQRPRHEAGARSADDGVSTEGRGEMAVDGEMMVSNDALAPRQPRADSVRGERGESGETRRGRGLRSRRNDRPPRTRVDSNSHNAPAVEGVDFVAGVEAMKGFQAPVGDAPTTFATDGLANGGLRDATPARPPRRGRVRNMRRPRDTNNTRTEPRINNNFDDSAGNREGQAVSFAPVLAPVLAPVSMPVSAAVQSFDDSDSIGNRINATPNSPESRPRSPRVGTNAGTSAGTNKRQGRQSNRNANAANSEAGPPQVKLDRMPDDDENSGNR
jgi:23S rRNA pseudouridine2605 synthase